LASDVSQRIKPYFSWTYDIFIATDVNLAGILFGGAHRRIQKAWLGGEKWGTSGKGFEKGVTPFAEKK